MKNALEDPEYRRRFNFIVRPKYVVDKIVDPSKTHTPDELASTKEYVNNLQIRQGIKDNLVDFGIYGAKPIDRHIRYNGRVQLTSGREIFGTHFLQWQSVNTQDDYF